MVRPGSYDVSTAHQDREAEVARLAGQASLGWEKEAAGLESLGFRDGMSIVELGSGPGFITRLLLEHFPTAQVTCVEFDQSLIEDARRHLSKYADRVTFVNASVDSTGLPSAARRPTERVSCQRPLRPIRFLMAGGRKPKLPAT